MPATSYASQQPLHSYLPLSPICLVAAGGGHTACTAAPSYFPAYLTVTFPDVLYMVYVYHNSCIYAFMEGCLLATTAYLRAWHLTLPYL